MFVQGAVIQAQQENRPDDVQPLGIVDLNAIVRTVALSELDTSFFTAENYLKELFQNSNSIQLSKSAVAEFIKAGQCCSMKGEKVSAGIAFHGLPVRRAKMIPTREFRSGMGGSSSLGSRATCWKERFNLTP